MDAIERVEVAARTALVYEHAHAHGPFGYTIPANLPNLDPKAFKRFLDGIDKETQRSREVFVKHFKRKYGDQHRWPPIGMAAEIMPFGTTLTLFRGANDIIKKTVASRYAQPSEVFESWLLSLNSVRNMCAHHARLWNRVLGLSPKIPRKNKHPQWHTPVSIPNDRVFAVLTILKYLLDIIAPQSRWPQRLRDLLNEYPDIPKRSMGFPETWEDSPLWKS